MSYRVVKKIDPDITWQEYKDQFIGPPQFSDLAAFLEKAQRAISLMQTKKQLALVVEGLFEQWQADHVIYGEVRFAPFEHVKGGLSAREIVNTVNLAVDNGILKYGIEARIILCTLRHYSYEKSMATVRLVEKFRNQKVVGFDIASDEAGYPIDEHVEAFRYAKNNNIPCTAHAGEAKGPESIRETLDNFSPRRIGHGVRCIEDEGLMDHLKVADKHLEICPSSNIQTNVYDHLEQHPVDRIYRHGISCGINTDNRTITKVTLAEEYQRLQRYFDWGKKEFLHANIEAMKHAFVEENTKRKIMKQLLEGWK